MCQILERMQCKIISVLMSSKIGDTPFNLEMLVSVLSKCTKSRFLPIEWICTFYSSYFGSIVMNNFRMLHT